MHSRSLHPLAEEKFHQRVDWLEKGTRQMRTGNDATQSGLYASECCNVEKKFKITDCFSRCPRCESLCNWESVDVVDVIVTPDGIVKIEHQAA